MKRVLFLILLCVIFISCEPWPKYEHYCEVYNEKGELIEEIYSDYRSIEVTNLRDCIHIWYSSEENGPAEIRVPFEYRVKTWKIDIKGENDE